MKNINQTKVQNNRKFPAAFFPSAACHATIIKGNGNSGRTEARILPGHLMPNRRNCFSSSSAGRSMILQPNRAPHAVPGGPALAPLTEEITVLLVAWVRVCVMTDSRVCWRFRPGRNLENQFQPASSVSGRTNLVEGKAPLGICRRRASGGWVLGGRARVATTTDRPRQPRPPAKPDP